MPLSMTIETTGKGVLDCAFKVHTKLGPGLLESVYEAAMSRELRKLGHRVDRQKPIPVYYDGELLEEVGFRADLIVDDAVLLELKSVAQVTDTFKKTTWNYLRLIPLRLGFLINFNEVHLKSGITRVANRLPEPTRDESVYSASNPLVPLRDNLKGLAKVRKVSKD